MTLPLETRYGGSTLTLELMEPKPNTTYVVSPSLEQVAAGVSFKHIFKTDAYGQVTSAYVENVEFFKGVRKGLRNYKTRPLGRQPLGRYDRGHLISAEMGAGMETLNLVWMPNAINQGLTSTTALKQGWKLISSQMVRHFDPKSYSKGTLSQSGEFYLPNYRAFERTVRAQAKRGKKEGYTVSVLIEPSTFRHEERSVTDIIYATIYINDKAVFRYKIESDIES